MIKEGPGGRPDGPAAAERTAPGGSRGEDRVHGMRPQGTDSVTYGVFQAFKRTMHLQRQLMARMLAEKGATGLHPAQAGCLHVLQEHDGLSQRDLADMLHLARPTVTTMLQAMERAGLVIRRVDAQDQRLTRVYLTEDGRGLQERMHSVFGRYMHEAVGSLSEEERTTLMQLLGRISDGLTRALAAMPPPDATGTPAVAPSPTPETQNSREHSRS